jgi:hemolysin activation/secretion protein
MSLPSPNSGPPHTRLPGKSCICLALLALLCLAANAADPAKFYIRKYKVEGSKRLSAQEVGEAVYPFLGPGRTPDDVEGARSALEKAYHDKGFQTVSVQVPDQNPARGSIRLQVTEGKVGRLRVNNSRWFLPSRIKAEAPSLAEGSVPDFSRVREEIVALNRLADRKVTPELLPGAEPDTVDINLNVEDKMPLHGSIELNNRYSADTTPLRVNGALSWGNLFQRGHTLGANFQLAPENTDDSLVYSGFYMARISPKSSLMLSAMRQDSDISTLGGAAVVGNGSVIGLRALVDLPGSESFYQNLSIGIDFKDFVEDVSVGDDTISSPLEYYPVSVSHGASWLRDDRFTELNNSLVLHFRGMGSDEAAYEEKRFNSSGAFLALRSDASHTRDLPRDFRLFGKVQGQIANRPLVNNEQIAGGGLGTVRGYLEATALGDNGIFATLELRGPTLIGRGDPSPDPANEWRFHAFADAGLTAIRDALPGQARRTGLASAGFGTRIRYRKTFHASADLAVPFIEQAYADDGDVRITFRGWADF